MSAKWNFLNLFELKILVYFIKLISLGNFKLDKLSNRLSKVQADNQIRFQDLENATLINDDKKTLAHLIKPLGLAERRSKALIRMSYEYNHKDWKGQPSILYGIGKYASDAYKIFCTDEWRSVDPKDGALVNYLNWLKSSHKAN